jgi:predicted nucleic acid-binding protein
MLRLNSRAYPVKATRAGGALTETRSMSERSFLDTPDLGDILAAIDLHRLHQFSFWDALVLRATKQAGCNVLLSEDLQNHREIDGIRIVNPFRELSK